MEFADPYEPRSGGVEGGADVRPSGAAAAHRDCVVRRRWLSRERSVRATLFVRDRAQLFAELRDYLARLIMVQLLCQFARDGDEAGHDRREFDGENTTSRFVIGHC